MGPTAFLLLRNARTRFGGAPYPIFAVQRAMRLPLFIVRAWRARANCFACRHFWPSAAASKSSKTPIVAAEVILLTSQTAPCYVVGTTDIFYSLFGSVFRSILLCYPYYPSVKRERIPQLHMISLVKAEELNPRNSTLVLSPKTIATTAPLILRSQNCLSVNDPKSIQTNSDKHKHRRYRRVDFLFAPSKSGGCFAQEQLVLL